MNNIHRGILSILLVSACVLLVACWTLSAARKLVAKEASKDLECPRSKIVTTVVNPSARPSDDDYGDIVARGCGKRAVYYWDPSESNIVFTADPCLGEGGMVSCEE